MERSTTWKSRRLVAHPIAPFAAKQIMKSRIRISGVAVLAAAVSCTWLAPSAKAQTPAPTIGSPELILNTMDLNGIACGLTCHAIGQNPNAVVVSGIGGSHPQTYSVPGVYVLLSIACPPAPNNQTCYAVGLTQGSSNPVLVPITTGDTGDVIGNPVSVPQTHRLNGIACPTNSTCYAVGVNSGGAAIVSIPTGNISNSRVYPTDSNINYTAIACPTTSVCYVVGSEPAANNGVVGLLATYTIPAGEITALQLVEEVESLTAIGCASSTTCFALGIPQGQPPSSANAGAVVQITNGSAATTAQLYDSPYTSLQSIACALSEACFVVGSTGTSAEGLVLPVYYNNLDTSGAVSVADTQTLQGVACSDQFHCYAVGYAINNFNFLEQGVVVPIIQSPTCPVCPSGYICELGSNPLVGSCVVNHRCQVGLHYCNGACVPGTGSCN
jgi:hypothetical protein